MASGQLDELMGVLGKMREAAERLASSSGDDAAFADAATDASLLFLDLKATNRAALEGIEATRATTGKAKLDLDHKRLELQNVVYEKGHIQKEIRACQDFRSAYDDDTIGLCTVAEFKKLAPAEWKEAGDDPHAVMLKRLSHELAERKKMCEREKELEAQKQTLQDGIKSRRKFLDGLGAQLKGLKRSTAPMQTHLALPISVEEKRKGAARALPPPLYVTYTQLAAAREAFDDDFEVHIEGSVADAEALQRKAAAAEEEAARRRKDSNKDSDKDSADAAVKAEDEETTRKSKRARVSENTNEDAVDERDTYAAHPLSVELRLDGIAFVFVYLHNLHVVTVNVKPNKAGANKGKKDVAIDDDLLVNLFPGDTGSDTPNVANKVRVAGFQFDASRRDRPYKWAQHLAGLDFLEPVPVGRAPGAEAAEGVAKHQAQARVRNVLAALRARMASRAALKSQLAALARCDIDGLAVAKRLEMHPKSQLRSWREITHKEETLSLGTETPGAPADDVEMVDEIAAGLSEDDGARLVRRSGALGAAAAADWRDHGVRTYRAVVRAARQPGGAKHARAVPVDVVAEVIVSPEYPTRPPAFSLSLERRVPPKGLPASDLDGTKDDDANTNGVPKTSTEDATGSIGDASNDLRLIEEEVNAEAVNLLPPGGEDEALGYCVVRLLQAVDACAECERWGGASDEAVGVRQMRRGRERRKELPPLL